MYSVRPNRVYIMDRVLQDPRCVERLQRLLSALGCTLDHATPQNGKVNSIGVPGATVIRDDDLPAVIRQNGWLGDVRQGASSLTGDPDIVFSSFVWDPAGRQERLGGDLFKRCLAAHTYFGDCKQNFAHGRTAALLGAAPFHHYEKRADWSSRQDVVCWSLLDLHSAWGCFHRCAYCQRSSVFVIMLNVEEFLEQVVRLMAEHPWQKTFRYDVEQDALTLEPEYGACRLLVEHFAGLDDRYLILFSKSANVDFLLPLAHRGHTIMLWTLSSPWVSRRFEAKTGTTEERLEAARRCQQAGYPVRFKFKPIIPTRDWRAEATDTLERLFAAVRPENLSMETVFFDSVKELDDCLGLDNLDPAAVAAAQAAEKAPWDKAADGQRPFPHAVKEEIYRHYIAEVRRLSPDTPITLCAESQRMWAALADVLGHKPWDFVCNCGPHCIPGLRRIEQVEGPDAARIVAARSAAAVPG